MKKMLIILGILVMSLGFSVNSNAITTFFDFEDGKDVVGELGGLENYLTAKFGSQVYVVPAYDNPNPSVGWWGKDELFNNSDVLFALKGGGTLDFDPGRGIDPSQLKITQISFTWGLFQPTFNNCFFGLDVFDDISKTWIYNIFAVSNSNRSTGFSGLITIDTGLKVTMIRFHDSNKRDVGLDNLTIVDNRAPEIVSPNTDVPEASIMLLLSSGLIGLWGLRRRFGK
jgi:hypothetical protein